METWPHKMAGRDVFLRSPLVTAESGARFTRASRCVSRHNTACSYTWAHQVQC